MFRDREEELDRLEAALMDEDEEESTDEVILEDIVITPKAPTYAQDLFQITEDEEDEPLPDFDAYNSDITDEDLEEYSETVYDGTQQKSLGLLAIFLLVLAGILFVLAWMLLKYGGFLG